MIGFIEKTWFDVVGVNPVILRWVRLSGTIQEKLGHEETGKKFAVAAGDLSCWSSSNHRRYVGIVDQSLA